jgi:hypothetical protein
VEIEPSSLGTAVKQKATEENKNVTYRRVQVNVNEEMKFLASDLLERLRALGFSVENHRFAYYSQTKHIFIYCGLYPPTDEYHISCKDVGSTCVLRYCPVPQPHDSTPPAPPSPPLYRLSPSPSQMSEEVKSQSQQHPPRAQERTISEVIFKVKEWRDLQSGEYKRNGRTVHLTSEAAAENVGVSKKSLDDYLSQLRKGRKHGFDFQGNGEKKMGTLREFNNDHKTPDPSSDEGDEGDQSPQNVQKL